MPRYEYSALDKKQALRTGVLQADSEEALRSELAGKSWDVTRVVLQERKPAKRPRMGIIKANQMAQFTKQLASLLKAKLPLQQCFELLERQEHSAKMKAIFTNIKTALYDGKSFSEALEAMPSVFDHFFVSMVQAGEASGKLEIALSRLAYHLNKSLQINRKVQSALIYPSIVLGVSTIVVSILVIFVIPKFQFVFENILDNAPMPLLTQLVFNGSLFIKQHWLTFLVLLSGTGISIKYFLKPKTIKSLFLRIPKLKRALVSLAMIRFYSAMGTLLANNVPVLKALEITRNVLGIAHFEKMLRHIILRVREGSSFGNALRLIPVVPETDVSLISVGEASGNLSDTFLTLANEHEEELEKQVNMIISLIEPLLIIGLTLFIGGIAIAMFLPILGILDKLSYF